MNTNSEIYKRLYKDYSKKYLNKIIISLFFSILVAGSTSAIAWLLDQAIKKIFIDRDKTLIYTIPILIIRLIFFGTSYTEAHGEIGRFKVLPRD